MKTNKFFATALAVLALVGFTACEQKNPAEPLELTETSVTLKVGDTHQLTANVAVESWTSSNVAVATVADGLVTAVSAGNAIISATAAGVTKTCVVLVEADQTQGGGGTAAQVKGKRVWPIIMDGVTSAANASKIVASFQPNDVDQFLYNWNVEGNKDLLTYDAATATGLNFAGNTEGYTAFIVGKHGWAGAGFNIQSEKGIAAAEELRKAIVDAPDNYFLHMAIKSTDNGSHCFYFLDSETTKFVIGNKVVYDGPVYKDFTRDGSWQEIDIPLSSYAVALSSVSITKALNLFVLLSEGTAGIQLNLDAVYFYEK